MQGFNRCRSMALGRYWQENGLAVVPVLSWAQRGTCAFCEMLASRGFVYLEKATAWAHVHDGCNCVPVPGFNYARSKVGGYDPDVYLQRYIERQKAKRAENDGAGASLRMTKAEYAKVTHAINDAYHARFKGENNGKITVGDCVYTFRIVGFGEYEILRKRGIE